MKQDTGTSASGVLLIVFVVLKLVGVIHWSWWWVFSPLWLTFLIMIVLFSLGAIVAAVTRS